MRGPGWQDAGLAAVLLAATVAIGSPTAQPDSGVFATVAWLREPCVQWVLIGVCVAAVAVRRSRPIPALVAATLAVLVQMALAAGPAPASVAVLILLYTVAAHRRRAVSLVLLGAMLLLATAWSAYAALDGRTDGWLAEGRPFGIGGHQGPDVDGDAPPGRAGPAGPQGDEAPTDLGPTDWGGIAFLDPLLVVAWAIGWGMRSRRAYLSELEARARDLEHERDQRAELAAAAERARITRELHDVVAHGLAVIVMQAQGGAAAFAKRPDDTLAALDTIVSTGRASLADIRHVLSASGPIGDSPRPVPGLAQLPRLVDQVQRAGTPVELRVDGTPRPLPTGVDVASYRIVQEALTNTMKHAGPGVRAQVVVTYDGSGLSISASDNGTGSPAVGANASSGVGGAGGESKSTAGNGLKGMRERVTLLGGDLEAGPAPGGGFLVRAHLPVNSGETI